MSEARPDAAAVAAPGVRAPAQARVRRPKFRQRFRDTWWRHLVGLAAIVVSLFPVVYIVSSAFNAENTLSSTQVIPQHVTLDNFANLFHNRVKSNTGAYQDAPYLHWLLNSVVVGLCTAVAATILGALAAYAFSRFRFRGRRVGMLFLLLIQMFPQLIAVAAIYLIVYNMHNVFPWLGLDDLPTLVIVYLAGAMGVQTWLMKGFFDTIPKELDESARVDGASPAQVFWGVVMPLATPVLAVVALISFVTTLNEFVLASALLQSADKLTLPVGMNGMVTNQYEQTWGPFCAGALLAAVPVVILFLSLQRYIIGGLTQGAVKG